MSDPFENLDFRQALDPTNWTETDRLHTLTLEAILAEGCLTLVFPGGDAKRLERSDLEALTRFLLQYANVAPLPPIENSFERFTPQIVRVEPEGDG